jgi:hypothetical protein
MICAERITLMCDGFDDSSQHGRISAPICSISEILCNTDDVHVGPVFFPLVVREPPAIG